MKNSNNYKKITWGFLAFFLLFTLTGCFRSTTPYQADEDYNTIIEEQNGSEENSPENEEGILDQETVSPSSDANQSQRLGEFASIADQVSWRDYSNDYFGYQLNYPGITNALTDDPNQSVEFVGSMTDGENWPRLSVFHYQSDFYRPSLGTDVKEWVKMFPGYEQGIDRTIAGLPALHFVQPKTPQAYAADHYYFIKGKQLFLITLLHSNDRQDRPLYEKFLNSFEFVSDNSQSEGLTYCQSDADCVPMPGCHPRQCINAEFAGNYTQPEVCTQLFDCQAAYKTEDCLCINNVCANANLGNQCFDQ
ncbi:MAG: hypothetical protein PHO91_03075 [Patescibacteria group bacterium]|nr:hypothetical protein [Patescibacteria group bacterium]